ncbi:hypothetical protein [Citromicrobium bathyomarinum]|uniref:hypothetical protein n=1 Tax=Citromicrobium bathyomarinum TaxID=72174 RepID=UPI00315B2E4D
MGMTQTASRLIAKHGQAATLLRAGPGGEDPFGAPIPGEDVEYDCTILTATYAIELKLLAGGFLDVDDQRVFVSVDGLAITPETSDRIEIDGTEYAIGRVSPLAPAGDVLFYELQVRDVL